MFSLEFLSSIKGSKSECITLQIPPNKKFRDVITFLSSEITQATNIQDKNNRHKIIAGIQTALE